MNKATTDEHDRVRIIFTGYDQATVPVGAAKVLLQMLRAATEEQSAINSQPPLAA